MPTNNLLNTIRIELTNPMHYIISNWIRKNTTDTNYYDFLRENNVVTEFYQSIIILPEELLTIIILESNLNG